MAGPGVDAFLSRTFSIQGSHSDSSPATRGADGAALIGPAVQAAVLPSLERASLSHDDRRAERPGSCVEIAPGDGSRLLAACLLERSLLRLGRTGTLVERRLAPGLRRLASRRLYRLLGYVRLGDYLDERLGMSLRRCQAILRLERLVEALPRLSLALEAGEVSLSKVEVVASAATAATETIWLERARRLSVADLREAVHAARVGAVLAGESASPATRPVPSASEPGPPAPEPVPPSRERVPSGTDPNPAGRDREAPATESIEQDEPGRLVSFSAPAPVFAMWHWTLDLVRRVAGRQEPAWRCAEYLAAEFLSGVPDGASDTAGAIWIPEARDSSPNDPPSSLTPIGTTAAAPTGAMDGAITTPAGPGVPELNPGRFGSDRTGMAAWSEACEAVREALAPAHIGVSHVPPVEPSPVDPNRNEYTLASSDDLPLHTLAPDSPVGVVGVSTLHTSAPARPAGVPGAGALHTSAPLSARGAGPTDRRARRRIVFWAPLDVAALWESALRACRAAAGPQLDDWECFVLFVQALRDTWENPDDPQWKRRYRIFERDGWRCRAPGCTSRSGLNEHHIVFRSQTGGDEEDNLVTLCFGHHQDGIHAGRLRCFGRAPDALFWDLGIRPGGEPLVRYFGERVVTRRPYIPLPGRVSTGAA